MTAPHQAETIVVIDDDHAMRLSCRKILAKSGFQVETFESGALGLEGVARLKPDLVLVDLKMPGISGLEVIARLRESDPQLVVIVITGYATVDTAVDAMKRGAYDFLPKPFSPDELRLIVNRALERRRLVLHSHRSELERALLKRRFVTLVSHQLQAPLAAVRQYLEVLQHLEDSPEAAARRREWFSRSLTRIQEMQDLIRHWLTLAKLEGETLAERHVRVDLKQVLPGILAAYADAAAAAGVSLEACMPAPEYPVSGEPNCLGVLFDNLVSNAVKYNRTGGRVAVAAEEDGDEIVVSVRDTGIGIPEEARQFLFDEFFRVPREGVRAAGSGLGLAICRRIVTELGGAIGVESRPGEGSTFWVRLLRWH